MVERFPEFGVIERSLVGVKSNVGYAEIRRRDDQFTVQLQILLVKEQLILSRLFLVFLWPLDIL